MQLALPKKRTGPYQPIKLIVAGAGVHVMYFNSDAPCGAIVEQILLCWLGS